MRTRAELNDRNPISNEPCYVTVFYGRPRIQRIAVCDSVCDFSRVSPRILSLPSPVLHPAVEVRLELVYPAVGASLTCHVRENLKGRRLTPGNVDQLIALASKPPQDHCRDPIVALGSLMHCDCEHNKDERNKDKRCKGKRLFPVLQMEEGELVLTLVADDDQPWPPRYRFFGYREGKGHGLWPPNL